MKKIFFTYIALLLSVAVFAQQKETHTYSLKEAVDFAIQNNNTVKNARLDETKAKAFNWEILTTGLPQVNASFEYDYYFKTPEIPAFTNSFSDPNSPINKIINQIGTDLPNVGTLLQQSGGGFSNISFFLPNDITTNLSINQLLFDGRYFVGLKARKDLYNVSRFSREMSEQDIKYTVAKAYYQAEAAQEAKSLLLDNLKPIEKLLSDTKAVFEQGLTEELDVNRLELAQATLQSQINLQNQMAEVGLANLKFQMGLPLGDEIILKDKLDELKGAADISNERKFDAKNRIEYDLLTTSVILKGYDKKQKQGGYYPTISAFLNYGWNTQTQKFGDMFHRANWYQQGLVGLSIKLPIFDSGLKNAQIKQARMEELKAINDFENFKNASLLQYQAAESGLNTAISDEAISQKTADLSKKIFNTNQSKFKEGVGSSFELVQSEQDYASNVLKHVQSVMNLLNAKADLDKAMGVK